MSPAEQLQVDNSAGAVRKWVDSFVVDLNLCPFARRELTHNRVRFAVTAASSEIQLLAALQTELELLNNDSSIATTLLIHPNLLQDFYHYNQFLDQADNLLLQMNLEGVYQIASFHPHYQFDGSDADDAQNYTNRSPYPLLHLLREISIERAIAGFADIDQVPVRNLALMNEMGRTRLQQLWLACFTANEIQD